MKQNTEITTELAVVSHFYSLELGKFYKIKFSPTIRQKYLKLKTEIFKVKVFTNNKTEILI